MRRQQEDLAAQIQVARMYYHDQMTQVEIARALYSSQSRISRLLRAAHESGIVETRVVAPPGYFQELESDLKERYSLRDVRIAPLAGRVGDPGPMRSLATTAASYLAETVVEADRIGLSSWSQTLLDTAGSLMDSNDFHAQEVVQMIGGTGKAEVQGQAHRLAQTLAERAHASLYTLNCPGVVAKDSTRDALLEDPAVREVTQRWRHLTVALLGIGSLSAPSTLIFRSGNTLTSRDRDSLDRRGAVGDVVLRFYDDHGEPVSTPATERIIGISRRELLRIPNRIGVAGGFEKRVAVKGAVLGRWVNTLVTDEETAKFLLED